MVDYGMSAENETGRVKPEKKHARGPLEKKRLTQLWEERSAEIATGLRQGRTIREIVSEYAGYSDEEKTQIMRSFNARRQLQEVRRLLDEGGGEIYKASSPLHELYSLMKPDEDDVDYMFQRMNVARKLLKFDKQVTQMAVDAEIDIETARLTVMRVAVTTLREAKDSRENVDSKVVADEFFSKENCAAVLQSAQTKQQELQDVPEPVKQEPWWRRTMGTIGRAVVAVGNRFRETGETIGERLEEVADNWDGDQARRTTMRLGFIIGSLLAAGGLAGIVSSSRDPVYAAEIASMGRVDVSRYIEFFSAIAVLGFAAAGAVLAGKDLANR